MLDKINQEVIDVIAKDEGDAIVRESEKKTYQFENDEPGVYNKENLLNLWFIVKWQF